MPVTTNRERYRMGVVGLGLMGRRHLEAVADSDRWDAVWAVDRDAEARAAARRLVPDVRYAGDAIAALDYGDVDAVLLATSADARPALVRSALSRGLPVLAEKPLAGTVAEELALLDDIEAGELVVGVNLFNRSTPYHRALVELVHGGDLGEAANTTSAPRWSTRPRCGAGAPRFPRAYSIHPIPAHRPCRSPEGVSHVGIVVLGAALDDPATVNPATVNPAAPRRRSWRGVA